MSSYSSALQLRVYRIRILFLTKNAENVLNDQYHHSGGLSDFVEVCYARVSRVRESSGIVVESKMTDRDENYNRKF